MSTSDQSASQQHDRTRRVIVGIDGSARSREALTWAVTEASLRGAELHAVTAWWVPGGYGDVWMISPGADYATEAGKILDAALVEALGPQEAQLVHRHLVEGNPANALIDLAGPGDLIVVGSHGHGGFVGALIGSVSQRVAAHAQCPVVIVRHPKNQH
ncbi:MAG: universal stress protein [Kineosporiaceae bacterium]|nr:universal stress protein [Kineosporiaceae bacterium]MBK7623814.1 universal stress protein [Kineosporiaceae bacterium]MBK8075624.1 universal stress protein [Kineosporiaceae bacterium]